MALLRRSLRMACWLGLSAVSVACGPGAERPSSNQRPVAEPSRGAMLSGTAPAGAIVTLEPVGAPPAPLPRQRSVMDQRGRQFLPDLLFVRVGQTVEFHNGEDIDHNIQVLRRATGTTEMNVSGSRGDVFEHTFEHQGFYDVICDIHPGMRATIVATRSPLAAVAGQDGSFAFGDLAPGRYVLTKTVGGRETPLEITVRAPETTVDVP